jgi:uncharacterized membrane protein
MYAVEFQAPIENGIIQIPKEYKDLLSNTKATFIAMYKKLKTDDTIDNKDIQIQLNEFKRLRNQSNNEIMATLELTTNIDELVNNGIS